MSGSRRKRALALVAAGVLTAVGITGLAVRGAAADPVLTPLTAQELLVKVATAKVDGLSATFEQRSDLGLPALPAGLGDSGDQLGSALSLLTGSHTVRVWAAGDDRGKVALIDGTTESSITRNGADVWAWSSTKQEAVHSVVAAPATRPSGTPTSPVGAIKDLLDRITPSTDVVTSGTGYVAGRPVYQLVLSPSDDASLVSQVRVSVDAEYFVPLGLRVIGDDGQDAVTVAATAIDFTVPAASNFDFKPPAGVTVTEHKAGSVPARPDIKAPAKPKTFGTGWATVAVMKVAASQTSDKQAKVLLDSLPVVSGAWGKGRLLSTVLVNAVITDDGRVAVGSVVPERLYEALAAR